MEFFEQIIAANRPTGEMLGLQWGIVASTDDPLGLQRVQVYDQAKGGQHRSDWLIRGLPFTQFSPPIPKVGELVVFGYIAGNPHHGCYLGLAVNQNNKPVGADSDLTVVLGDVKLSVTIGGDVTLTGANSVMVDCQSLTAKASTATVESTGNMTLKAQQLTIDSPQVTFSNTSSLSVGGQQIATIGAVDTQGHTLTTKGW